MLIPAYPESSRTWSRWQDDLRWSILDDIVAAPRCGGLRDSAGVRRLVPADPAWDGSRWVYHSTKGRARC